MSSWGTVRKKEEAPLSKETSALLADMMKQRGLSLRAQQDITTSLKRGDAGWVDSLNTGTSRFQQAPSKTTQKVKVPTFHSKPNLMPTAMGLPPASFSGKRMATQIPTPEREQYSGHGPGPDRNAEKERLALVMEVGAKEARLMEEKMRALKKQALENAAKGGASKKQVDVKEQLIDTIIDEIRERREFLEEMRAAGRGDQYEGQIKGEIASRLAELKKLGQDTGLGRPAANTLGPKPLLRHDNQ